MTNAGGPQGSAPSHAPAAPASVTEFPIHGTGMETPTGHNGIDSQLAALERRLRAQEVEIAANKFHAARDGASGTEARFQDAPNSRATKVHHSFHNSKSNCDVLVNLKLVFIFY